MQTHILTQCFQRDL